MGANQLPLARLRSVWAELAAQLANMFAVVLLVAAGLTFLIYFLSVPRDTKNLILAFGILGVVVLNALIGFIQEHAAERTAEALQAMVPRRARVLRAGQLAEVPAEDLVPGDVVSLEAGDAVSADARLIEVHALSIEMAALTGESQPVGRTSEAVPRVPCRPRRVTACSWGRRSLPVPARRSCSRPGLAPSSAGFTGSLRIAAEESPLQRQVTDMARRVAAVAIAAGVVLFALRVLAGSTVPLAFVFALGVMVALVPEGLPATLSVSLAIGVRRMARRNALIKRLTAVEALGSTTVICTDKTGTLTKAEMTVQQVFASGRSHAVTGAGYGPSGGGRGAAAGDRGVAGRGAVLRRPAARPFRERGVAGARGHDRGGDPGRRGQGGRRSGCGDRTPRVGVFPFDPGRKLMTTVHQVGDGYRGVHEGLTPGSCWNAVAVRWRGRTGRWRMGCAADR